MSVFIPIPKKGNAKECSNYHTIALIWHPTPLLLPGKPHGRRSLVGCSPWGRWVRHDWVTSLSLFTFMHWRRKWQPTPVFLPGESQGREAWWAAVYGVAQSRTRLKRLSSSSSILLTYLTVGTMLDSRPLEFIHSAWFFSLKIVHLLFVVKSIMLFSIITL